MAQQPVRLPGIKGKNPVVQKLAYQLRYRRGYTYLDKCGRIVNMIQREYPEWVLQDEQVSPQNAPLISLRTSSVFSFSSVSLSLALEKPLGEELLTTEDIGEFVDQADKLTALVVDQLGIGQDQFTRIGFRPWYMFPCQSREDSERWLLDLGCYQIHDSFSKAFQGAIDSVGVAVVITGDDRCYRIGFNGAERQAQVDLGEGILTVRPRSLHEDQDKFLRQQLAARRRVRQAPEFVAIIDIDAYQENPQVLDVRHFLDSSWQVGYQYLQAAVKKK